MKNIITIAVLLFNIHWVTGQIGIGNTDPKATLDISIDNPSNPESNNGLLIPRLNNFPAINPSMEQDGLLIFLNQGTSNYSRGFHYWSHELTKWIPLEESNRDFYVLTSTENPTSIEDDVYRQGKLTVGSSSEGTGKMNIIVSNETANLTAKPRIGLYIENNHPSTGSSYVTYGIDAINQSAVNGPTYAMRLRNTTTTSNAKYGISNNVSSTGDGIHYGISNEVSQGSTSTSNMYGIKNLVNKTHGASSSNYGIHNEIGSTTSAGNIYGIYSKATGNASATVYSGYFLGRFSVGLTTTDNYLLPATRGTAGQVLTAAPNGETVWSTNGTQNVTSITTTTSSYTLNSNISTIRITAVLTTLNIPDATSMSGKIFRIINGHNNNSISLSPVSGQIIQNDVTGTTVTSLAQNRRLTIQSNGTNWFVIDN